MKLPDLLHDAEAMAHTWNDQITLERHVYEAHFQALRRAYYVAGLVLLDQGPPMVPGYDEGGVHMQIQLFPLANGEMFGSRYLIHDEDDMHVDEVDILMFNHRFDTTAGRLRLPTSEKIIDYTVTPERVQHVTNTVLEICQTGQYTPEAPYSMLEMPK